MVSYRDEIIIKRRREKEKEKFNSIELGMYVGEQLISFKEQVLDESGLQVVMPDILAPMDEEMKKRKFPMEQRPPIIWSNSEGSVTFTFNLMSQKAQEPELHRIRDDLGNLILSVYPHYIFTDKGQVMHDKGICQWTEFLSPVVGGMLYSILFTACMEEHLLIGMFNCPSDDKEDWKRVIFKVVSTIRKEEETK